MAGTSKFPPHRLHLSTLTRGVRGNQGEEPLFFFPRVSMSSPQAEGVGYEPCSILREYGVMNPTWQRKKTEAIRIWQL